MKKYLQAALLVVTCTLPVSLSKVGPVFAAESAKAKENLEKLIQTKVCKGCDLSGLIMNRLDLAGADLEGSDLSSAKLNLTNLAKSNLKNTNLRGTIFGGTDLSDADLRGADLRGASLDSAYHQGALFDGKFIVEKPSEDVGGVDVPKEVFIADPTQPKKKPETKEAKVGDRRDSEAPLAASQADSDSKPEMPQMKVPAEKQASHPPVPTVISTDPEAKKAVPVQPAVIDVPSEEEKKTTSFIAPQVKVEGNKQTEKPLTSTVAQPMKKQADSAPEQNNKITVKAEPEKAPIAEIPVAPPVKKIETTSAADIEKGKPIAKISPVEAKKKDASDVVEKTAPVKAEAVQKQVIEPSVAPPAKKIEQIAAVVVAEPANTPDVAPVEAKKEKKPTPEAVVEKTPKTGKGTEEKTGVESGGETDLKTAASKDQESNLARLLDKNKCYACDLSGLDLSGKNLDSADLEKANLTGCNLEKTDLEKANLKGALLLKANLSKANLKNADFYKADLAGADFTDAKVEGAMFDGAQTRSAIGLKEAIEAAATR